MFCLSVLEGPPWIVKADLPMIPPAGKWWAWAIGVRAWACVRVHTLLSMVFTSAAQGA